MKNIFKYIPFVMLSLAVVSCTEDYLEKEPSQNISNIQIQEASELNPGLQISSLTGIYSTMSTVGSGGTSGHDDFGQKGIDVFTDFLSMDMVLSVSTYGWYRGTAQLQTQNNYTLNQVYIPWRYYYRIVFGANQVIDALGGQDITPETDEAKEIMGQAKILRAYAYFYLTQLEQKAYDPSEEILPIYTNTTDPNQPLSPASAVYDLIVSDLNDGIALLESTGFVRPNKSAVDPTIGRALLAYTYGAMQDFDMVAATTSSMMGDLPAIMPMGNFDGGVTGAYTSSGVLGGFSNINDEVNNSSWMWGLDVTLDLGLDLISWWGQVDAFTYSYAWAGDAKAIDAGLFDAISENDVRKYQFYYSPGSYYHLLPMFKMYDSGRAIGGQRNVVTDYVYMRSEEIYLLDAEAKAKTMDEAGARTSLKAVVEKRMLDGDASYIDALSGQALIDEIYFQTRLELWGEGKSYLAMKRNKATITRGSNHLYDTGASYSYDDPRLTYVIPQAEVDNNPLID